MHKFSEGLKYYAVKLRKCANPTELFVYSIGIYPIAYKSSI